jgi:hypothetical protein
MTPRLDAAMDELHRRAADSTGMSDFGDDAYLTGFDAYLRALCSDLGLGDVAGLVSAAAPSAIPALVGRLHSARGFAEGTLDEQSVVCRPVFIVGMPRTGTTALHHMLGLDPQFQGLESWLVRAPRPRPPRATWPSYAAFRERATDAAATRERLQSSHWVAAEDYDECQGLMAQTFVSNTFGSQRSVPSYDEWYLACDHEPAFVRLHANLRLIGSTDRGSRRWLLKNPSHLFSLDALFTVFPDAQVVLTHRDPLQAIPSLCNLLWTIRQMRGGATPDLDPLRIGRRELAMWSHATARMQAVIEDHEAAIHHVHQRDLQQNSAGTIEALADRLGITLSPTTTAEACARARADRSAPGGQHHSAETFGLTDGEIAATFASYREQFGFA